MQAWLEEGVKEGKLTQEQAERLDAAMAEVEDAIRKAPRSELEALVRALADGGRLPRDATLRPDIGKE